MSAQQLSLPSQLTKALRDHVRLPIVCDFLKKNGLATARSWDDIFSKHADKEYFFNSILKEVLCFGSKTIFAYEAEHLDVNEFNTIQPNKISILQALLTNSNEYRLFSSSDSGRFVSYSFFV